MTIIAGIIFLIVWLYILWALRRSDLPAWRFIWGSCGLFVLMMIFVRPYCTQPLAQVVAAIAGAFGKITGMFSAYYKYGVVFVDSRAGAISLLIDFECSGILEIMAYLSLLAFFQAYSRYERIAVGVIGTVYIILANAIRITVNRSYHLLQGNVSLLYGTYFCWKNRILWLVDHAVLYCIYKSTDCSTESGRIYVWN